MCARMCVCVCVCVCVCGLLPMQWLEPKFPICINPHYQYGGSIAGPNLAVCSPPRPNRRVGLCISLHHEPCWKCSTHLLHVISSVPYDASIIIRPLQQHPVKYETRITLVGNENRSSFCLIQTHCQRKIFPHASRWSIACVLAWEADIEKIKTDSVLLIFSSTCLSSRVGCLQR